AGTEEEQAKNFQWGLRRNSGYGHDQRNRGQQSNRSANSDTQESVVELLVLASSVVSWSFTERLQEEHHCGYIWSG
nr:hypothetical protein [Tanacetum cinerariifolium]